MVSTIFPQLLPPQLFLFVRKLIFTFYSKTRVFDRWILFLFSFSSSPSSFFSAARSTHSDPVRRYFLTGFFLLLSAAKLRVVVVWAIIYLVWVVVKLPAKMALSFYVSAVASSLDTHILTKEEKSRLFLYLGDLLVVMISCSTKMTSKIRVLWIT